MRMGEDNVPKIKDYLAKHMISGDVLGFDGRTCSAQYINEICQAIGGDMKIRYDLDLCDDMHFTP